MKDGVDIPANIEVSGNPRLYFPADKFEEIMNILRHEEPLFISHYGYGDFNHVPVM
jgi:hypothetical protein